MQSRTPLVVFVSAVALGLISPLFPACAGNPSCEDYGDCPENAGSSGRLTGGKAGATGGAGHAGVSADSGASGSDDDGLGGKSAGGENAGGENAGTGDGGASGAAGGAGAPPCNGDCPAATPVCDAASNRCVECLERSDCKAPTPACDTAAQACVECVVASDCTDSSKRFCDQAAGKCVMCSKQADCSDPTASACRAGACTACTADADCSNIAGKGVCDAGTCVQCTGKNFAACGMDAGTPLVCDSLNRTCTTSKQRSAGLCVTCVADAQCKSGQVCVLDKFGSPAKEVGYFCHWKKGDLANGAPADCFSSGKPYSGTQVNVTSIDGELSDICVLRSSTCIANNQFSAKDCTAASAASDAACGFAPPKDAKCAQVPSSSSYRCTMTCLSDEDCPGSTCDTGAAPRVCAFN
jgi:hypothetical protein